MKNNQTKRSVFLRLIAHREQRRFRVFQIELVSAEMNKATENILCSWSPEFMGGAKLSAENRPRALSN